jgi:CBS domain-containing protein
MSGSQIGLAGGDYLTPEFTHATVADAMRHGVIACPPGMPLRAVARMMATNHVHSVVVIDRPGDTRGRAWGIVTDLDVTGSAAAIDDLMAGEVAVAAVPTVHPDAPLADAARVMTEQGVAHLVVVMPSTDQPIGVISTLDIAGNLAWARG